MQTEHMVSYSANTIREFYEQGIISQAQYEAYEFIWANTHITSFPYFWGSLLPDSRVEFWKLFKVLPVNVQKIIHQVVTKG